MLNSLTKTLTLALCWTALFFPRSIQQRSVAQDSSQPRTPAQSAKLFKVPTDLRWDSVLAEPQIAQPVFCNFDERGRLWVVEYRQYPDPAGLKVLSKDQYYRSVYDKTPLAPPNHIKGADRISIHEDTNGDGRFDSHKIFVDGLNIVTSVARGRGGVWVLNPPYLLFYPDQNNDDVPDGDPIVHLSGFGLEDTHSCTNSLRWGPDGWLYAAQGSTVTGNIVRPGIDKTPVRSMGQLIWRYHPERRLYEIFAEGGGNAFGVEIDSVGRIFSGHNGGNTRGFHYPQGGYLRKGFTKHGALSNPFAFGFFPHMKHPDVQRFTHNFIIYEAEALPTQYRGHLLGIEPLQGRVVESQIQPRGSTFETKDLQYPVKTEDTWFTPVDIKLGPDGGVYVCDWYDNNVSHLEASVGKTDKKDGRIYRLTGLNTPPLKPFNLSRESTANLANYLKHPNRWFRQTALRLLGDRKDQSILPLLKSWHRKGSHQLALECLWAIYQIGGLEELIAIDPLSHENPHVRKWAFRLICDENAVPSKIQARFFQLIKQETDVETRTQIASSAKRLPSSTCLRIVRSLLQYESDTSDPYQPLLIWWAIESKCADPQQILEMIRMTEGFWENRIVCDHLANRLVKRFTLPATQNDFRALASLFQEAQLQNPAVAKQMLAEFENTTQNLTNLVFPEELLKRITQMGGASLELQVRQNNMESIQKAIQLLNHPQTSKIEKEKLIRALGDIRARESLPSLLSQLKNTQDQNLQIACLQSLQKFNTPEVGQNIIERLGELSGDALLVAQSVLVARPNWSLSLLQAIEQKKVDHQTLSDSTPRRMLFHDDETIPSRVRKLFGEIQGATNSVLRTKIEQYFKQLQQGNGSPYEGKKLFVKTCAKCHRLYQNGADIGPDLTTYQRNNVKLMLLHIVNPSAEIREGFENFMFSLEDGRILSGFIKEQTNQQIVLTTPEGTDVRFPLDSIESRKAVTRSLMPTKLLESYTPQQRRDLFAFLRSTQPLNN
ncbi:MAG: PVC-type heme-binding CxxCH protein [Planctomycetota bacterium]|nr:PVC-type heme-binding CxxCH protein [Planctomycetota bacterium]